MNRKKKKSGPQRSDRRFIPQSSHSTVLVRVLGGVGAMTLGAGAWGYFYGHAFDTNEKLKAIPAYLVAAGSILTGAAVWLGTSSDPPLRVGDPGIGIERGEVRRMPWWAVSEIAWDSGSVALAITGKDESGTDWSFKVPVSSHPEAAAWIVREARRRVPMVVGISEEVLAKLPSASSYAGTKIDLEPLQVVGKRCAMTGTLISYEPDARSCERCERVYLKRSVPKTCACGATLVRDKEAAAREHDAEGASG